MTDQPRISDDQHNNAPAVPQGWKLVQTPITEEMHVAAVKVLHRAPGLAGLPQRMLDAMLAATPAPAPAQEGPSRNDETTAFERWLERTSPSGDVEQVHRQWLASSDYEDLFAAPAQDAGLTDEVPKGFVPLQRENGKLVYAACLDGGRYHGWLMWMHPDGQWVTKRKMSQMEIMQAEDQEHYGIVQDSGTEALRAKEAV